MKKFLRVLFVLFLFIATAAPAALSLGIARWTYPTKIKTYIPPNNKRSVMMKHAFQEWTRKTNGKVVFLFVTDQKNAQIEVKFVKVIPNADREIGLTMSRYIGNAYSHADIYIAENTVSGHQLSNDNVYTVMLHEIGHAIGLPHSGNILSIMYPSEDDRQEIRAIDLEMLSDIYKWK